MIRKTSPQVSIVILNWNNAPDTIACLDSVSRISYSNYTVLVVDNGSDDGSRQSILNTNSKFDFLPLGTNTGYAEGNNSGIKYVLDRGAEYVLILNNDTIVEPSMLDKLVEVAESSSNIGMVGPTVLCTGSPERIFAAGSFILWKQGDLQHRGMYQPLRDFNLPTRPVEVDFLIGCCVLVRRKCIEKIGYFNPQYYLNYEDVEWGLRSWRTRFQVIYEPSATIEHKVSATLGIESPSKTYYMTRNALLFFGRYSPYHLRGYVMAKILFRTLRTIGAWTVRSEYQSEQYRIRRNANLYAIRDFFLGRYGKMGADVERVCFGG